MWFKSIMWISRGRGIDAMVIGALVITLSLRVFFSRKKISQEKVFFSLSPSWYSGQNGQNTLFSVHIPFFNQLFSLCGYRHITAFYYREKMDKAIIHCTLSDYGRGWERWAHCSFGSLLRKSCWKKNFVQICFKCPKKL